MAQTVVRTRNLRRVFMMGETPLEALRGVNVDIESGEYVSLLGPSGSGKSTFFNMIGGLDKPTEGRIFIDEVDIAQLDAYELAWLRCRKIGYIFQTFNLLLSLTSLENVMHPMLFGGLGANDARDKAYDLLKQVGLGDRISHRPVQLSGGQQQRVAIARALANDPAIVLADEPTGNLDQRTGQEIIMLLKRLNSERGVTVISATHDLKMLDVSDRIMWIRDGRVERVERREEVELDVGRFQVRRGGPSPRRDA